MQPLRSLSALFLLMCPLVACGDGDAADADGGDDLAIADDCNPLGGTHCMTPWPSSAFEVDAATPTGRQLAIGATTLIANIDGRQVDPAAWNRADGFSPAAPIVVAMDAGFSVEGLVGHDDIARSLTADSPTVLIDMTTGERVAHFAELDAQATRSVAEQALLIRPAARLASGHRYAVGLTTALRDASGAPLARPPGFTALLAGDDGGHPRLAAMLPRFPAVLAALADAGVAEADLLLAWDFTVASGEFIRHDLTVARDRALAAAAAAPITFTVDSDTPVDDGVLFPHQLSGTFTAPLMLTRDGAYGPPTTLTRDASGDPEVVGSYQAPFDALIPACAYTSKAPVGVMIYGHGLMGTSGQAVGGSTRDVATTACVIVIGTDMRGMSDPDIGSVLAILNDASRGDLVFDVLLQGLANHMVLIEAVRTTMASDLFVTDDDGDGPLPPRSLVDPAKVTYYGLSQGGIFGTTLLAYDPHLTRAVVGVGGANYSTMLERSTDWPQYRGVLNGAYPSDLDVQLAVSLFQMQWDRTEPSGVLDVMLAGDALGVPPKQILIHEALADNEVPNLATEYQARSMGVPVLTPSPTTPYGIPTATSPIAPGGSALVIFDGGVAPPPFTNIPAPDTGAHYLTREQPATWRQIATFFATGEIVNECDGACVCTGDACE